MTAAVQLGEDAALVLRWFQRRPTPEARGGVVCDRLRDQLGRADTIRALGELVAARLVEVVPVPQKTRPPRHPVYRLIPTAAGDLEMRAGGEVGPSCVPASADPACGDPRTADTPPPFDPAAPWPFDLGPWLAWAADRWGDLGDDLRQQVRSVVESGPEGDRIAMAKLRVSLARAAETFSPAGFADGATAVQGG